MRRNPRAGACQSGGFRLEVFTDDELNEIHLATLEVLSRTGVFVEDDEALQIFADAGADHEDADRRPHGPHFTRQVQTKRQWAQCPTPSFSLFRRGLQVGYCRL